MATSTLAEMSTPFDSELELSDLLSAKSSSHSSPGLLPNMSSSNGMSLTTTDVPDEGGVKPRPFNMPLLNLPEHSSKETPISCLSDLYPGVHNFLRNFPAAATNQSIADNKSPPLLNPSHPDHTQLSFFTPPIHPPTQKFPLLFVQFDSMQDNVPHPHKPSHKEAEFVLPNVPVKPFVPRLLPLECVGGSSPGPLPMLQLDDPLTCMKREGTFQLLKMPRPLDYNIQFPPMPVNKKPAQVNLTLYRPNYSRRRSRRKPKQKSSPIIIKTNMSPPTLDTPTPLETSSDVSLKNTPTISRHNDQHHANLMDDTLTTPTNGRESPSHKSPSSHRSQSLSHNSPPSHRSQSPSHKSPPSHRSQSPSHKSPPSHCSQSPSQKSPPSHCSQSPSHRSQSPSHKSQSPSPSQASIAIQVDMTAHTVSDNNAILLSDIAAKDFITDQSETGHQYIAVSDIESENEVRNEIVIEPRFAYLPPLSPSPVSSPPLPLHSLSPHMKRFQDLEEQLLVLEQTAENMKEDLVTSKRVLQTIDRISNNNVTTTSTLSKLCRKYPSDDSQGLHILNEDALRNPQTLTTSVPPFRKQETIDSKRSGDITASSTAVDNHNKSELRKWMNKKYYERHKEYKTHREELRSKERVPYQPQANSNKKTGALCKSMQERRLQEKENYNIRLKEAHELMNDLVLSKVPSIQTPKKQFEQHMQYQQQQYLSSSANFPVESAGKRSCKRRISSVEGLSVQEQDRIAEILATTELDRESVASTSTVATSIDWSDIDNLLLN